MRFARLASLVAIVASALMAPSVMPSHTEMTPLLHGNMFQQTAKTDMIAHLSAVVLSKMSPVVYAQAPATQAAAEQLASQTGQDYYPTVCSPFEGGYSCGGGYYGQPTDLYYVLGLLCGLAPTECYQTCSWVYAVYDDGSYNYLDTCGGGYAGFWN